MLDESTALVDGYSSFYSFSRKRSGYSGKCPDPDHHLTKRHRHFIKKHLFLGVATYCKNSYSPFQAEEGLAGTFNVHDDKIDFYDNVHSSFTDEGLRALDAEGRCVMTLHKFKVRSLFSFFYT
jgi:AP endonuclease-2